MNWKGSPDSQRNLVANRTSETANSNPGTCEQDPTYYYPDGNIVFLAGDVLFKLHASLILPVDSISPTTRNEDKRYPIGVKQLPEKLTDSSETNPIVLLDVTAHQFRTYLFALLSRPYKAECWALFTDAKCKEKHNQPLLVRYLDIAEISRRFGMSELEQWAASQLELILESFHRLAEHSWDKNALLRLNSYTRTSGNRNLRSLATTLIQYFISISVANHRQTGAWKRSLCNLGPCVQLFSDPCLPNQDPALFGCVFASVLSLGHRSTTWISGITSSERLVLYAAQVHLTSLSHELKSVKWLDPTQFHSLLLLDNTCDRCRSEYQSSWEKSLAKCGDLNSPLPLQDVAALVQLPQYRELFIKEWTSRSARRRATKSLGHIIDHPLLADEISKYKPILNWLPSDTEDTSLPCKARCGWSEWPLAYVDAYIQQVYEEFTSRYKVFASEARAAYDGGTMTSDRH